MASDEPASRSPSGTDVVHRRAVAAAGTSRSTPRAATLVAAIRVLIGLLLFVGALQVMKTGASALSETLEPGGFLIRNAGSTFGVGWLGAMFALSGTPVVAAALSLVAATPPLLTETQGFTMVTGGRMGAAFIVLLVAVVYALRGGEGERKKPVSTAVLTLTITAAMYIPGAALGLAVLRSTPFQDLNITLPEFGGVIDFLYGWLINRIDGFPPLPLFVGGVILLIVTFRVFDAMVPKLDKEALTGSRAAWLRKKWPMFGLGLVVVIATLSVSVALTVLVPLVAKGYVKREDLVPYIIGADIGTLVDKLLLALLLHSAAAVRIIVAEIIGVTVMGLLIMVFIYPAFKRAVWKLQKAVVLTKPRLGLFTVGLFVVPVAIVLISGMP